MEKDYIRLSFRESGI